VVYAKSCWENLIFMCVYHNPYSMKLILKLNFVKFKKKRQEKLFTPLFSSLFNNLTLCKVKNTNCEACHYVISRDYKVENWFEVT